MFSVLFFSSLPLFAVDFLLPYNFPLSLDMTSFYFSWLKTPGKYVIEKGKIKDQHILFQNKSEHCTVSSDTLVFRRKEKNGCKVSTLEIQNLRPSLIPRANTHQRRGEDEQSKNTTPINRRSQNESSDTRSGLYTPYLTPYSLSPRKDPCRHFYKTL